MLIRIFLIFTPFNLKKGKLKINEYEKYVYFLFSFFVLIWNYQSYY